MTGKLRYLNWIACMMILIMGISCNNDKVRTIDDGQDGEEEVELIIASPVTYATDPGSATERRIKELDVLVFKNDEYQYRRHAKKIVSTWRTTLKIDDGLTLYFVANSRSVLDASTDFVEGNSWENDIRPNLILQTPDALIASDSLPMWGIKENVNIEDGKINSISDIYLLRAVASVDIYNGENPEVFQLKEAYIYFAPNKGFLAPSASNYDPAEKGVDAPVAPDDMVNLTYPLSSNVVDAEKIFNQLYLYENDAPTSTIGTKRYSRIVVGGSFEGGNTTYYPVDILDDDLSKVLQVTRNFKYIIYINSVKSPGFPDPDTASEEFDTRLSFDIIDWNLKEEKELVFDGPHFISLESKRVYLYKPAGSVSELDMTTNIETDKLTMEFIDSGNGTQVDGQYVVKNDRFQVEFIFDDNNEIEALRFTALGDFDTVNDSRNHQVLKIYSSRVEFEITIEQLNESPTEWIDGGNKDVELGGEEE